MLGLHPAGKMDGEAGQASGRIQRERKRSYEDLLMDQVELEELDSEFEECSPKRLHKRTNDLLNEEKHHSGDSGTEPEHGAESFHSTYLVCLPQDKWGIRVGEEAIQDNLLHSCCPAEGSIHQTSPSSMLDYWVCLDHKHQLNRPITPPASPVSHRPGPFLPVSSPMTASIICSIGNSRVSSPTTDTHSPDISICGPTGSSWSPGCFEQDPISAAAHLHLLGESLSLIGHHLQGTNKLASVSSSMSLLLDSLLCALAPLICLTDEIPELRSCTQHTLASTLENIAYLMPGM